MKMSRKAKMSYSAEFKAKVAIDAIKEDKTVSEIASEKQVDPKSVRDWKKELIENSKVIFDRNKEVLPYKDELKKKDKEIEELYKQIGQLTVEVNWAKKKVREAGL